MRRAFFHAARHVFAGIALIGICSAPLESLIPDAHDDHAGRSGDALATLDASHDAGRSHNDALPAKGHPVHMDHCSHAHLFSTVSAQHDCTSTPAVNAPAATSVKRPASVSLPPRQRPPIK